MIMPTVSRGQWAAGGEVGARVGNQQVKKATLGVGGSRRQNWKDSLWSGPGV